MKDPASPSPVPRDAGPPAPGPDITDYATRAVTELSAAWPGWQIWTVHRVYGGTVWCARPEGWRPGQIVLNAGSPEDLAGYLAGQEQADQLDQLRGRFPAYVIDRHPDRLGRDPRYVAVARDPQAALRCVISDDPAEVAAALTAGGAA